MKKITIVAVCYNEKDNILPLYQRVAKVFESLKHYDFELIYADNKSQDGSEEVFRELAHKDKRVKVILMARNSGQSQYSFLAGMRLASGHAAVLMDGDIQDPPELIPKLIEKWEKGYKVVYGIRSKRKGSFLRRFLYKLFYRVFRKLSYIDIPLDAGDFGLIDRKIINKMIKYGERDYYVRGLRAFTGFEQIGVEYTRDDRAENQVLQTSIFSYLRYARTLIVNFSFKPLEWISKIALLVTVGAFCLIIFEFVLYFIGPDRPAGIPTVVMITLFLGAIQLLCLSIIAEYLGKIFMETKNRPRYLVKEILNDNDQETLEKISE